MIGRYRAYPEYKGSGVEWLGSMPSHWLCSKIKYGYDVVLGKMLQKEKKVFGEELKPYLKAINIQPSGLWLDAVDEMWFSKGEIKSLRLVSGDVLVSEGGDVGRAAIWSGELPECYIQNAINRVRPLEGKSSSYLYYWMSMLKASGFIDVLCNKATIAHYTAEKLGGSELFIPPLEEAENIAGFLDYEIKKIDRLIDKQKRLIKVLKEKHQAVISFSVTKGLDPNSLTHASGVEWLGYVPKDWNLIQIRRVIKYIEQGKSPECESRPAEGDEWGVLKTGSVNNAEYNSDENKALPSDTAPYVQYEVKAGDLLMSRASGSKELIGSVALVSETRSKNLLSDKIFRIVLLEVIDKAFFKYLMQSTYMRLNIVNAISGAEGMANNITKSSIMSFRFALPSLEEQRDIVVFLNNKSSAFRRLLADAEKAITIIEERRSALISAAVTGKIDVRDWVAPEGTPNNKEVTA